MENYPKLFMEGKVKACIPKVEGQKYVKDHPCVIFDNGTLMFFQNEIEKKSFMKDIKSFNPEYILGEYLGYPPLAIEDSVKGISSHEIITVKYEDLIFVCKESSEIAVVQWLERKYDAKINEVVIQRRKKAIPVSSAFSKV